MTVANVYLSFTAVQLSNSTKAPLPVTTVRGGYYTTRPGKDTPLAIAGDPSNQSPTVDHRTLAYRITTDPKNNPIKHTSIHLNRKSLSYRIRDGVDVWVPPHVGTTLTVMVGDNPPQPTKGYANWSDMKRPLQRGLTIFQNYDPAGLQIEVRFGVWTGGSWDNSDTAGQQIESDIWKLEWMAGHGIESGPPPVIYAYSYRTPQQGGGETDLIPWQYKGRPWIINGGIQWGKSWRNSNGYRTWQEATFVIENYQTVTG